MLKRGNERRIETATWGLLLLWVASMMLLEVNDDRPGLASVGAGVILVGSAVIQKALRYEAGLLMWAVGAILLLGGMDDLLGTDDVPFFALLLMVFGAFLTVRGIVGRRWLMTVTGVIVAMFGLDEVLDREDLPTFAVVLIAVGLYFLVRAITGEREEASRGRRDHGGGPLIP